MSVSQGIYIGPYMVVKNKDTVSTFSKRVCVNTTCQKTGKEVTSKFCPECGQESESKKFSMPKSVSVSEHFDDMHDDFYFPHNGGSDIYKDKQILMPNTREGRPQSFRSMAECVGEVSLDLTKEELQEEYDWFEHTYSEQLMMIRNSFGSDNCKVGWGIVIYYS